jgi:putative phage-type endonuclease
MSDVGALPLDALSSRWVESKGVASSTFSFTLPNDAGAVMDEPPQKRARPLPSSPKPFVSRQDWLQRLETTQEEANAIARLEQGTGAWLKSREGRLTGSNFGAAAGMNKFMSPRALLKQMLWGEFKGNAATRWGSDHEDVARDEYVAVKRGECMEAGIEVVVEQTGLVINPIRSWMGNSPDGIVLLTHPDGHVERGLLEIKCPFRKVFYAPDPVPSYYYAQIQGTMGNLNLPWCDFVVWTPTGMQVTHVPFNRGFWENKLLPALTTFYFDLYLPLALDKENGLLEEGCVESYIELNI